MKNYIILLLSSMFMYGCVNDNVFEKSDRNIPTEIRIGGQINSRIVLGDGTAQSPDTAFVQMKAIVYTLC